MKIKHEVINIFRGHDGRISFIDLIHKVNKHNNAKVKAQEEVDRLLEKKRQIKDHGPWTTRQRQNAKNKS